MGKYNNFFYCRINVNYYQHSKQFYQISIKPKNLISIFAIAKGIHNQCIRKNIKIIDVGVDILVAGTAIINSKDYAETIKN